MSSPVEYIFFDGQSLATSLTARMLANGHEKLMAECDGQYHVLFVEREGLAILRQGVENFIGMIRATLIEQKDIRLHQRLERIAESEQTSHQPK